ncbi:hypothetical protein HYT05_04955 [Candidatus Kaiserbacteria bacterium]|nr:hypothetical protein [Candidatus Kaiserbacteria bacterium]
MNAIVVFCLVAAITIGIAGHIKKRRDLSLISIALNVIGWWGLALLYIR